ncbi:MAG: hypothetical protein ACREHF_06630, partial [Rhizomicrobium sp.]
EVDLPVAPVFLQRFLAPDGGDHAVMMLVPDEPLQAVLPVACAEPFLASVSMGGRDNGPAMTGLEFEPEH